MFGKRADGRRVYNVNPFDKMIPYLMKERNDAQNFFNGDLPCEGMDRYIAAKKEEGIQLTYMQLILAACIRTIAERPLLNRFIMNSKIYAHNKIWISFSIKKTLREDGEETSIKMEFEGTETLMEICTAIESEIQKVIRGGAVTETDDVAKLIMTVPDCLVRLAVNVLMFMDRHNCMPKMVLDASPFHTTMFFTNLKSLGLDYIYHHLSNFGTMGTFFAMGKEKLKMTCTGEGKFKTSKVVPFGFGMDERICDGTYFARSVKMLTKYVKNPELMETPLEKRIQDVR